MRVISKKLRDSAKGQDCTLRIPGVCSFDPEQTILAHVPCGQSAWGMKAPDNMAVFSCHPCHVVLDGCDRDKYLTGWDVLRALAETQLYWIEEGMIKIYGQKSR